MDINGGAEKTAWDLHRRYRALGHESYLAVGIKRSDDPHTIELGSAWLRRSPARFVLSGEAFGVQGAGHPASRHLRERVGSDWDIAHLHNLHGRYFDLAAIPELARVAPTILTMHDMWLLTGHCAHPFGCARWETGCGSCPDLTIYPAARFDFTKRNLARKQQFVAAADGMLVTSPGQWLLDILDTSFLGGLPRVHMPNTVDTSIFYPGDQRAARTTLGLPLDAPILMFPARLLEPPSPFKGQPLFVDAMRTLAADGVTGIAFGDVTTVDTEATGIHILPATFDERVLADGYRAADVVVMPSQAETSGIALLEAMACGRPVVATHVGGIGEVVEDGVTGFLVAREDREGLIAACRALLASPEQRARFGEAGRRAASSYELTTVADRWLKLYASLIMERGAAPRT